MGVIEMKDKNNVEKKEGFFKRAFREMKESMVAQHKVDKANFEAVKAESRAQFEENRGTNTLKKAKESARENWENAKLGNAEKVAKLREEQEKQIVSANERKAIAEERINKAREIREEEKIKRQEKRNTRKKEKQGE